MSYNSCTLCLNSTKKTPGISLHQFPKAPLIRCKWLDACEFTETDVAHNRKICPFHFSEECYTTGFKKVLKPGRIPTVKIRKSVNRKLFNPLSIESKLSTSYSYPKIRSLLMNVNKYQNLYLTHLNQVLLPLRINHITISLSLQYNIFSTLFFFLKDPKVIGDPEVDIDPKVNQDPEVDIDPKVDLVYEDPEDNLDNCDNIGVSIVGLNKGQLGCLMDLECNGIIKLETNAYYNKSGWKIKVKDFALKKNYPDPDNSYYVEKLIEYRGEVELPTEFCIRYPDSPENK
ncbi:uncharacterized protein LOC103307919 [Acyrthosiphon pisum]|uniref:THAP-type domain-containing protein n=1 Tax=Acyrthosiphon pisum TaxID=7029 RepID=A0A8R2NQQ2_ACYPI|nr:uncharacterized protein LOC103307919 [Acyrthosiphon pisum]